jgi:hypothetical protein
MNRKEILKFITENQNERLLDYYDKCYEKLRDLNRQIDKLTLYLIIIIFLYFIASSTTISSLQIGPANISDISLLLKIIPVIFAFILLQIVVISSQKAELFTIVKMIFLANYIQDVNPKHMDNEHNNVFTRLLLPFSYSIELLKFNGKKDNILNNCFGALLGLPLLSLIFLPFYFEYYMLKVIWNDYFEQALGMVSFWLSIWIMLYLIYYLISNTFHNYQENKAEFK